MAAIDFVGHIVDDDGFPVSRDFITDRALDLSSPPGCMPNVISSLTLQAIHLSSVTRETAATPIPVVRCIMSRMRCPL